MRMFSAYIDCSHTVDNSPDPKQFLMHAHDNYEIYCFLSGDGYYTVEGNVYNLSKGDLLIMRKAETHKMQIRSASAYERVTLNFYPEALDAVDPGRKLLHPFEDRPLGRFNHFRSVDFPENEWSSLMLKMCKKPDFDVNTDTYMMSYFLPLVCSLNECFERNKSIAQESGRIAVEAKIVDYVNRHLFDELSLDRISERFFLSKSQINRVFKRATGTSVFEYVSLKRLMEVRSRIKSGQNVKSAALECGFNDYSSFYRAYRARFGISPHSDKPVLNHSDKQSI